MAVEQEAAFMNKLTVFLFLFSDAFVTVTSYPNSFAIITAADVLPIPGGPESNAAFEFTLMACWYDIPREN